MCSYSVASSAACQWRVGRFEVVGFTGGGASSTGVQGVGGGSAGGCCWASSGGGAFSAGSGVGAAGCFAMPGTVHGKEGWGNPGNNEGRRGRNPCRPSYCSSYFMLLRWSS